MSVEYDKYYQTKNLFGAPYPELIDFYAKLKNKGKLLDLGCGQGRDAIPLAKLGFTVTGIDYSKVGIEQLNKIAEKEKLPLIGVVGDIYSFSDFKAFEFILLDSMFHFGKKERQKEIDFLNRLFTKSSPNTIITICIQKVGKKLELLHSIITSRNDLQIFDETALLYIYVDQKSNHSSETEYQMLSVKKTKLP